MTSKVDENGKKLPGLTPEAIERFSKIEQRLIKFEMSEKYSRPIIEKAAELDLKDIYN
jgi:hypothetical protein